MSRPPDDPGTVGQRYRRSRLRIDALVRGLDARRWRTPVPACPGWRVHDVVAHLVGVVEDGIAGRIQGPPGPEQTAEEVERHRHDDPAELLDRWAELARLFEPAVSEGGRWPAFFDVLSHEHDLSGALGGRGPREASDVALAASFLTPSSAGGRPLAVVLDGGGPGATSPRDDALVLRTTAYELFRLRLGRRTRAQVLALDWSEDPGPAVDDLFVFGPAAVAFDD